MSKKIFTDKQVLSRLKKLKTRYGNLYQKLAQQNKNIMIKKVIIRQAKAKDWRTIQTINHQSMKDNIKYDPNIKPDWEFTSWGEKFFKSMASDKNKPCFIAEINDQPVGYLNGSQKDQGYRNINSAEIENVAVIPEYQSQGIGIKLIQTFKDWCKQKNITHLQVNCFYRNKQAIKLYKKTGLSPIDISFEGEV